MAIEGPNIRGSNPVWSFVDLNAVQFNDTFYMWVLENTIPYIPATVWHDPAGTLPWTDPIQFLANGTLPIDIFWDPTMYYRLEFRQNIGPLPPSQADPLIYLVENYSPGADAESQIVGTEINTGNQISNPQFATVNFDPTGSYTLTSVTNPPPIEVAPGWYLTLTGTGSVTVKQVPLNTTISTPTNAPYALEITLTGGWTGDAILSQTFVQNGQNWQGLYASTSITARVNGSGAPLSVNLVASNGQPLATLLNTFLTNTFVEYTGNALIPSFVNLNTPPNASIEYEIILPPTGDFYITSVQLALSNAAQNYNYEQTTVNSQINNLFYYYQPKLNYKPIPSYLVGWDFPLNPAQFLGDSVAAQATSANQGYYAWDQTIIYQTVPSSVTVARGADGSFQMTCAVAGQVAIIQYLDQVEARKILSDRASLHLNLYGAVAAGATGNVTLWATTDGSLPTLPTTFISTINANGIPATVSSVNWTQVPNLYQNTEFTVPVKSSTNAESNDISLNGWDMQGAVPTNTATYFAIVVGFTALTVGDTLNISSVGLCPGDIATRPAPQKPNAVLNDCQRFYYSTFPAGAVPTTNYGINTGYLSFILPSTRGVFYSFQYPITMRADPTVIIYNPLAANNQIRDFSTTTDCSASGSTPNSSEKAMDISATTPGSGSPASGDLMIAHVTSDARLGVV